MNDDSIKRKQPFKAKKTPGKRPARRIKPISESYLRNVALFYLQRYASSVENLRSILMRRVQRASKHHETDQGQVKGWIDQLLADYQRTGLLDDSVYLKGQLESLKRKGESKRAIFMKLKQKGLSPDLIQSYLEDSDEETELQAAERYIQRKRLGIYRTRKTENDHEKDMAALTRAGFSYDVVRKTLKNYNQNYFDR